MEILNKRASGVLLHITSLPSEFGIGDLGSAALGFTDYLKKAGQQYWQILPLNPTGASNNYSPYACYSAFAGNPLLISPVQLYEEGLVKKADLAEIQSSASPVAKECGKSGIKISDYDSPRRTGGYTLKDCLQSNHGSFDDKDAADMYKDYKNPYYRGLDNAHADFSMGVGYKQDDFSRGLDHKLDGCTHVDYKRAEAAKNKIFKYAYNNFRKKSNRLGRGHSGGLGDKLERGLSIAQGVGFGRGDGLRRELGVGQGVGQGSMDRLVDDFYSFCFENDTKWLDDFACFVAFKKYFKQRLNMTSWSMWPRPIRDRSARDIKELREIVCKEIELQKFLQFLFFRQWKNLKRYANANGIKIFGDVPIYVGHESSDVWSHPSIFKLNREKMPAFIAGVPPDYYSKTGQIWKSPVYNWRELKKTGFSWWIDRMKFNFDMFDLVRLDHFRGFIAYWEVAAGEKTAINGRWASACPEEFFTLLSEKSGLLPIVAENLGIITPDVNAVMEKFGFPGIRVLQFAFGKDFPGSSYLPHNYIKNTVACTGTHDNNTLRGWLENEAKSFEIKNLIKYLGEGALPAHGSAATSAEVMAATATSLASATTSAPEPNNPAKRLGDNSAEVKFNTYESTASGPNNAGLKNSQGLAGGFEGIISKFIILLMASAANLVIIPMQDILGLGKNARMNRPSTSRGNWKWQLSQSMLSDSTAKRLAALTRDYKRDKRE